ncbi:uncharacterized protein ACN427_014364 isoform 1-T1 [Glossina fuscipes fuscipes]
MEKKLSSPIIIYADIEAVLKPIEVLTRSEGMSAIQQHEVFAVSYYVKHVYNEECDEVCVIYFLFLLGETCIADFLGHMQRKMEDLYQLYWTNFSSPKELLQNEQHYCKRRERRENHGKVCRFKRQGLCIRSQ